MKTLYLIRGISGSGKTTLAEIIKKNSANSISYSVDEYFVNPVTNRYEFDKAELDQAHLWCLLNSIKSMAAGILDVIVHNTFTQQWELDSYRDAANRFGYTVFEVVCNNRFRNVHDVPFSVVHKQQARFEYTL